MGSPFRLGGQMVLENRVALRQMGKGVGSNFPTCQGSLRPSVWGELNSVPPAFYFFLPCPSYFPVLGVCAFLPCCSALHFPSSFEVLLLSLLLVCSASCTPCSSPLSSSLACLLTLLHSASPPLSIPSTGFPSLSKLQPPTELPQPDASTACDWV